MLCEYTNKILRNSGQISSGDVAIVVGMDGWHLTRAQLDAFPDAKLAHDRRGAHWTFDGEAYVAFVRELREPLPDSSKELEDVPVIYAPSFSHELKDPTPRALAILPQHRLIIIEGLYMFLGIEPWAEAGRLLDERWWVEVAEEEAEARLVARHVLTGVARDVEEAEWRARENDAPSKSSTSVRTLSHHSSDGRFLRENMLPSTKVIVSVEDPVLKGAPI